MTANKFGGPWTADKLDVLRKYLHFYVEALSAQPFRLIYIDSFAGTGRCRIRHEDGTHVHAAKAVVRLTAPRNGFLTEASKSLVRYMAGDPGYEKVKVRLTDETRLIDIVSAPLRESIAVELYGRYPRPSDVYRELEAAYDRRREQIQRQFDDEH